MNCSVKLAATAFAVLRPIGCSGPGDGTTEGDGGTADGASLDAVDPMVLNAAAPYDPFSEADMHLVDATLVDVEREYVNGCVRE
jgi:hypothetical protein